MDYGNNGNCFTLNRSYNGNLLGFNVRMLSGGQDPIKPYEIILDQDPEHTTFSNVLLVM